MISSARSKLIRSLSQKKYREQHRLFVVEGEKMVGELCAGGLNSPYQVQEIFASPEWIERHTGQPGIQGIKLTESTRQEIKKVSNLVTPQPILAIVSIPDPHFRMAELLQSPVLAFESIRDPGNLGTIIRTADWFGMGHILCTPDSADLYNPKVVQSTMGAITRVKVHYVHLESILSDPVMKEKTVYGTFLEGENIYETSLETNPLILFGNEAHGLSANLDSFINRRISIPSFSPQGKGSESLNVASSVAVICSELRRR